MRAVCCPVPRGKGGALRHLQRAADVTAVAGKPGVAHAHIFRGPPGQFTVPGLQRCCHAVLPGCRVSSVTAHLAAAGAGNAARRE